ncbi:uncharacterized protein TRAVEDRAFT_53602 [Trametes versicolor FP-101664 SS1]|uniref:uncharacterized protein n=1 Tax=Trametes versicolor (strain FP-101664) TaxID=717944 RepID=UPI0004621601|nr:uncharacterized protein TRAVEDRAFT_53602 [Trametes versicolor FP-101664 SS1]EIW52177.1 hypothetical protein TRAVEDRAFT_53602 [Trametes versicolor FP-101664 SS1]
MSYSNEDAGSWSPPQGNFSNFAAGAFDSAGRIPRGRTPSDLSYNGEDPAPQQQPPQHRHGARSPAYDDHQSSPPRGEDDEDDEDQDEDNHEPTSREKFPKAQRAAADGPGSTNRAKQGNYDPEVKQAMALAVVYFKSMIMAEDAYPDKLKEKIWASTSWYKAAEKLSVELAPTAEILGLIAQYSWNLRGEIKVAARGLVQGTYAFKPFVDTASQDYNRQLSAMLTRNRTFTYDIIDKVDDNHEGLYEASVIQMVVNRVFYKNPSDDGIVLDTVYHPFPEQALALVLTAIQCAIDEWNTGAYRNVTFSENDYGAVYEKHRRELKEFELRSGADRILTEIRTKLSKHGRLNAKAPAMRREDESSLTQDAMDRAVRSYNRRKQAALREGSPRQDN